MKLNLYDENLNRIAILGDRFLSCFWSEGYNTVQPFTLELQETAEYQKKVRPDCYVGREGRKTLMVIKTVQNKDGRIIASGKQAARCLEDVVFVGTIPKDSVVAQAIPEAYAEGVGFHGFAFAPSELAAVYGHQISNKNFLELLETMCQDTDLGFRTVRSDGRILVEFYQPEENPNLVFSELYGNLTPQSVILSTEKRKNYAVVLGEGEEENRTRVDVDLSGGAQKRSLIIDARDLTREEKETEEAYLARLEARGYEKLLEQVETWECAFAPHGEDFGSRYDLGDILTVLLPKHGLKLKARIARFTQKVQNNKSQTTVEVGTITITR